MKETFTRSDDYATRRKHLEGMSDEKLKTVFWQLADRVVSPLVDLAYTHTTPAIERSVLLRMGFSSLEAKALVDKTLANGLIGKGAGHVVYRFAKIHHVSIRDAGLTLIETKDWSTIQLGFEAK